jgi:flagellar hook protein FlgE
MGSLYSAISGLQSSSRWLDVISNNVSNSNSVGYKYSRVSFSDMISQGLSSATGANSAAGLGGINPNQVGMGVSVSSVQNIFTQGALQTTGNATDVAISGSGFFSVKKGSQMLYTRAGNFTFDSTGNLVSSDGGMVQGWTAKYTQTNNGSAATVVNANRINGSAYALGSGDPSKISTINIPTNLSMAAQGTGVVKVSTDTSKGIVVAGNLDAKTQQNVNAVTAFGALFINNITVAGGGATLPAAAPTVDNLNNPTTLAGAPYNGIDPFLSLVPDQVSTATVYDTVGNPRSITIQYYQVADTKGNPTAVPPVLGQPPQWAWFAFDTTVVPGHPIFDGKARMGNLLAGTGLDNINLFPALDTNRPTGPYGFITFNTDGSLQTNGGDILPTTVPATTPQATYNPRIALRNDLPAAPGGLPNVLPSGAYDQQDISINFGTANTYTDALGTGLGTAIEMLGQNDLTATNAFSSANVHGNGRRDGLTGDAGTGVVSNNGVYTPTSTAKVIKCDGYQAGQLVGLTIDAGGNIVGSFTNNQSMAVAQIALANFQNASGLNKTGNGYYSMTANSGLAQFGVAGKDGLGNTMGGALESSNVDLTIELTNMIVAQRMFESNARVITAADQILNTLVNLGR